ncbi:MAG: hypothetical protein SOX43_04565 [Pelistega sp.]|nr:hypothetical protein [Pelistega sp.]
MNISRVLMCTAVAFGLSGCLSVFQGGSSQAKTATPAPVVVKADKAQSTSANVFNLYVGSTQKGEVKTTTKKGKRKQTTTIKQDVPVEAAGVTYYTSGPIVAKEDVRNAFVAKTIAGEPALGIRLSDAANSRLTTALAANQAGAVLASLNNSVFSKVNQAGAKLQDGVLLLPMNSLNEARDVAAFLRNK